MLEPIFKVCHRIWITLRFFLTSFQLICLTTSLINQRCRMRIILPTPKSTTSIHPYFRKITFLSHLNIMNLCPTSNNHGDCKYSKHQQDYPTHPFGHTLGTAHHHTFATTLCAFQTLTQLHILDILLTIRILSHLLSLNHNFWS